MASGITPASPESMATPLADRLKAADALWAADRLDEARQAYEAIVAEHPGSATALCRLGDIRLRRGEIDAAHSDFVAASASAPASPWPLVGLGRIAEARGAREEAIAHFSRVLALNPDLAAIAARLDRLRATDAGIAGRTDEFAARFRHANDLLERRRFGDAEAIYRELLQLKGTSPSLMCKLATLLIERGRLDEAMDLYERAIAADPRFVWSYLGRAELHEARNQKFEALRALETARQLEPGLPAIARRLRDLRRRMAEESTPGGPPIIVWPATATVDPPAADTARRRVAIVAWDLTHNPVGRAWVLAELAMRSADCEIVGPLFPTYGDDLWGPLRETVRPVEIRGFRAGNFADFLNGAIRLVEQRPCDVALVSKPRFPSLLIGLLYKLIHGARLVLDIDDDELAFVDATEGLDTAAFIASAVPSDWEAPHDRRWTRLAASFVGAADARTVCNPVLQQRFGGTIVRHARDERLFASAAAVRSTLREEFGFTERDKVILFLGTPRRHKGLLPIATALRALGDSDAVLCIVGTIADKRLQKDLSAMAPARISFHPDQPFHRLAALNAMADVVCVLQDPASPIAFAQTPAKLTDALATGTPIIATALPPIADLIGPGEIMAIDPTSDQADLVHRLRGALVRGGDQARAAEARRAFFTRELSSTVNAARIADVLNDVLSRQASPMPAEFGTLLQHIASEMPAKLDPLWNRHAAQFTHPAPRVGALLRLDRDLNVVLFWKQNDSGIYGRRHDMLVQALSRLPSVRRILQIDAPICIDKLIDYGSSTGRTSQGPLIAVQTLRRFLNADDFGSVHRRTFVYRGETASLLGRELPPVTAFPKAVERWIGELDMSANALAWVCPVVPRFAEVQRRLGFSFVLTDVIDDQRQWPMSLARRAGIEQSYREIFAATDAAVANCEAVADWLADVGLPVRLVPNGMEMHPGVESWPVPAEFAALGRPIVGYSGNLSDRIDWPLIQAVATARPDWTIVLIGAMPASAEARAVIARANVHALGVIPYEQALRYIAAFDVAIIPHLHTPLSERMNPLKLYVYRSLGVPVVSTPVANTQDLIEDIRIAGPATFVAELDAAIAETRRRGRTLPDDGLMRRYAWDSRLRAIMEHAGEVFASKPAPQAGERARTP